MARNGLAPGLFLLRGLIIVFIIFVILYAVNPEIECWCNERWETVQEKYGGISDALRDKNFNVPLGDRRPPERMKDYYRKQDTKLFGHVLKTRNKYKTQYHLGSVMKTGFHSDLPPDAMWRDGIVEIGEDIREMSLRKAEEKPMYGPPPEEKTEEKTESKTSSEHV
jgi:hypothetical protein